jgi:hypothetical protein
VIIGIGATYETGDLFLKAHWYGGILGWLGMGCYSRGHYAYHDNLSAAGQRVLSGSIMR